MRILVQSPTLIDLDFPLTTLLSITGNTKQFLSCSWEKTTRANLSDYAQQDLSKVIKRSPLDMQRL
jgi:hypothetical protein